MKLNVRIKSLVFFLVLSCNSYQKSMMKEGNINNAIENLVIDFSQKEKNKINTVYKIRIDKKTHDLYKFNIGSEDKVYMYARVSIGSKAIGFPSKFLEVNKRLYIWEDSTQVVSKEIIEKLHEYKVLDSTLYKIDMGQLPQDKTPVFTTDESKKNLNYFFCKKDISKFEKIKTNKFIRVPDYPKVSCEN